MTFACVIDELMSFSAAGGGLRKSNDDSLDYTHASARDEGFPLVLYTSLSGAPRTLYNVLYAR